VPASFTQHEREAVYTAADIADLKVSMRMNKACALFW
jgi:molecular chaperone DnaK (HSP70)